MHTYLPKSTSFVSAGTDLAVKLLIEFVYEMISLFICIHFIHEFDENIQGTNGVSSQSKSLNVADKYVVLETPQKDPPQKTV